MRSSALAALAVVSTLVGCGARSELDPPELGRPLSGGASGKSGSGAVAGKGGASGSQATTGGAAGSSTTGGAAGTSTTGGAAGTGGTGPAGAGGTGPCASITWAGEPMLVSDGNGHQRPRLVRTNLSTHALVFESPVLDATLVESAEAAAWDGPWPFALGPLGSPGATGWSSDAIAVGPGEPGTFSFALAPSPMTLELGFAPPGGGLQSSLQWPASSSDPRALARNNVGAYLLAHGSTTQVSLDVVQGLVSTPVALGTLGCASKVDVAAVGVSDDAFLVASTNQLPFDACLDPGPLGPPTVLQLTRVTAFSTLQQGDVLGIAGPLATLSLTGRIGGAWLTYRVEGDPTLHVHAVTPEGKVLEDQGTFGNPTYGDEVIAYGDGFLHVTTYDGQSTDAVPPFVQLEIRTPTGFVAGPLLPLVGMPMGKPAVATNTTGTSALVAFQYDQGANAAPVIGLVRADCLGAP